MENEIVLLFVVILCLLGILGLVHFVRRFCQKTLIKSDNEEYEDLETNNNQARSNLQPEQKATSENDNSSSSQINNFVAFSQVVPNPVKKAPEYTDYHELNKQFENDEMDKKAIVMSVFNLQNQAMPPKRRKLAALKRKSNETSVLNSKRDSVEDEGIDPMGSQIKP